MANGSPDEILIAFESGHYKKVFGEWGGDSVWMHFIKDDGGMVHVNKDKVEYIETFDGDEEAALEDSEEAGVDAIGFHVESDQGYTVLDDDNEESIDTRTVCERRVA